MSAKYLKQRNSQHKNKYNDTWASSLDRDDNSSCNSLHKQSKPHRRVTQHLPTIEHDLQVEEELQQDKNRLEKLEIHRRLLSGCEKQYNAEESKINISYPEKIPKSQNLISSPFYFSKPKEISSSQEIEMRFQEIESIMGIENDNLREQKEYLLKTIQKMQFKEKEYKNELKAQKNKIFMLESENRVLKDKYEKAKDFISNGIGKIEQEMKKEQIENNETQNTNFKSDESSINATVEMEELNERFEILMYEYQKNKSPEIRKKCVEIAKELKKLKKLKDSKAVSQEKSFNRLPIIPKSPKFSNQISKKLYSD